MSSAHRIDHDIAIARLESALVGHADASLDEIPEYIRGELEVVLTHDHAARILLVTLAVAKVSEPRQMVRAHKLDFEDGFAARPLDNDVVLPWLREKNLTTKRATSFLTRQLAQRPFVPGQDLGIRPKALSTAMPNVVCWLDEDGSAARAELVLRLLLAQLLDERDRGAIELMVPKNLTIEQCVDALRLHFAHPYRRKQTAPRLPQLALYALLECLVGKVPRYTNCELAPLMPLKSADAKAGTLGDIEIIDPEGRVLEAIEVKFELPVSSTHVNEAFEKVKPSPVLRYFILSTSGVRKAEAAEIASATAAFFRSYGTEVVVDGVIETIEHHLRLLPQVREFVETYISHVRTDADLNFEQKIAWNACIEEVVTLGP